MNFHDRLRIPIPMHDLLREIQAKDENPADTVQDLINKFPLEQADILNHYFPLQPLQVERFAMQSIFRQLLENHKELLQEKQAVVWLYSVVGAVSVLFNFILLVVMGSSKYKSSTALFLVFLALTDFITAATLLIELFYISMGRLPLYQANQHFRRQLINFGRHLLQFISIHLLTLVAIDRWVVFNTSRGRLFKEYRVLKLLLSLCIPLMAAAVVSYQFSPTVELKQGERSVRIYTCVQMGCRGSRMVLHHWRSSNDQRASTSSVVVFLNFALITVIVLPLYTCIWSAASQKITMERHYEDEREELVMKGCEVIYFQNLDKSGGRVRLPVIYEVEETSTNIDKNVLFPYTLRILHEPTNHCAFTKEDNFDHDEILVPENAEPLPSQITVPRSYDTDLDKRFQKFQPRMSLAKHSRSGSSLYAKSFTNILSNTNRSALSSNSAHMDKMTQTEHDPGFSDENAHYMCEGCQHHKQKGHRTSFFTKQIVFSINCCCNKAAPIECLSDMTYFNETNASDIQNVIRDKSSNPIHAQCGGGGSSTHDMNIKSLHHDAIASKQSARHPMSPRFLASARRTPFCPSSFEEKSTGHSITTSKKSHTTEVFHQGDGHYRPITTSHNVLQSPRGPHSQHWHISQQYASMSSTAVHYPNSQQPGVRSCTKDINYNKLDTIIGVDSEASQSVHNTFHRLHDAYISEITEDYLTESEHKSPELKATQPSEGSLNNMNKKSLYIFLQVKSYFLTHSQPLPLIGVPKSLLEKVNSKRAKHAQEINARLLYLTCAYYFFFILPWMIEMRLFKFTPMLGMSNYFCGLCQFISLIIFSSQFRNKCLNFCFQPCSTLAKKCHWTTDESILEGE